MLVPLHGIYDLNQTVSDVKNNTSCLPSIRPDYPRFFDARRDEHSRGCAENIISGPIDMAVVETYVHLFAHIRRKSIYNLMLFATYMVYPKSSHSPFAA